MANAFTLFGTLNIDAKRFQAALRDADKNLKTTASSLDAFEKRLTTTGNLASHIAHQIDKLASSINRLKSSANGVKNLTITLQGVGGAATSAANSVSKVAAAGKKASVDTSQLQGSLDRLEGEFTSIKNSISEYAGRLTSAGKMNETARRSVEKMQQALANQKAALQKAIEAYTSGAMSARQFVATVDRISASMAKLSSKVADATARLKDSVAAERAAAAAKQQARAAAEAKRAATERERAATQAARAAAQQAAAAHRQQAAAMRQAASAAKAKGVAVSDLGKKISSAGASVKGFGTDLTYLVSVPMAAFGTYAFNAATGMDAIINKLTAATGSTEQANTKFQHFMELAQNSPGVFAKAGASLFAAFKPMGLSDTAIDEVIRAFGRLKTAEENFDFDQFRLNMAQMFGQKFEMQDMKQALTFFPRFAELLSKQMGLATTDLDSLQKHLKQMQDSGVLTFERFALDIAQSVNNDKNFGLLEETLGNRFKKMAERVEVAIAPLGTAIADRLEPAFAKLVAYIENLSKKFQALPKATQDSILKFGGLAAIIGPVIATLGALLGVIGFVAKGISYLYAPIAKAGGIMAAWSKVVAGVGKALGAVFSVAGAKVIAIILAIVAAAYIAYKSFQENWGYIGDIVMDVYSRISTTLQGAINEISKFWHFNKGSIKEAIANIMSLVAVIMNFLSPIWYILGGVVMAAWDVISVAVKGIWQIVSSIVMAIVHLIRGDFKAAFTELGNFFIGILNVFIGFGAAIVRVVNGIVKAIGVIEKTLLGTGLFDWIGEKVETATDAMVDGIPMMETAAYDLSASVGEGFSEGAEVATKEIKTSVTQLITGTETVMNEHFHWLRKTMEVTTREIEDEFVKQKQAWKYGTEEYRKEMANYGKVIEQLHIYATQGFQAGTEAELAGALKAYRELLESTLSQPLNVGPMRDALEEELKYLNDMIDQEAINLNAGLKNMGIFTMPGYTAEQTKNKWANLGAEARAGLLLGINPTSSFTPGVLLGQNLAAGFAAGINGLKTQTNDTKNDVVKPPPGAKGGGRAAAQDFFEGLIEGVKMLKASANASLAQFFDIKQLRSGLKGKAGQSVVDFVKPIVDEMAKLPESATYLDQFNQKFGELAKSASPQMRKSFEAITTFLKEAQKQKDAAKAIETTSDAVQLLKDKLKELEGVLKTPKTKTQEMMEFLEEFQKKHGELAPDLQFWIMYRAGLIDAAEASKNATEALKEQSDAYIEAVGGLMEFVNLNAKNLTNTQQLELFLIKAAMAGQVFSEELVNAARAAATAADSLETQKTALAGVKTKLSELGVNIRDTIAPQEKLKEVFADTAGLQLLATELGVTVTKLRELILESYNAQVAIGDLMKPTADGMGVTAMTEMDVFVHRVRSGMLQLKKEMPSFSAALGDAVVQFASGIGDVFVNAMQEWDGTFKGFFRSVLQGFAQLVQQILAELLKIQIMKSIFSLFPSLAPTGTGGSGGDGFGVMGGGAGGSGGYLLAAGGLVRGPGTGTSDSIPAMLSNGEYVIPANVVKQMGVGFFDQIRSGRMTGMPAPMPSAASVSNTSNVVTNQNTFNISVPAGAPAGASGSMIQREIISALQKSQRRNR